MLTGLFPTSSAATPNIPRTPGLRSSPGRTSVFENAGFILGESQALAMGNYFFADESGNEIKVEYTLGYFRVEGDGLKINLHHSSLPFE